MQDLGGGVKSLGCRVKVKDARRRVETCNVGLRGVKGSMPKLSGLGFRV